MQDMNFQHIIAKILSHPWVAALLVFSFLACNFAAWRRIRRERKERGRPWRPPH